VPDLTRVPLVVETKWQSKTVTTDAPRYTPHLEWAIELALKSAEPLRVVVFIEVAWRLVAHSEFPDAPWIGEYFGDVMLVNGKVWPYLNVEPRLYRVGPTNSSGTNSSGA
jgi:FtsP/CotA-like multicopper oxidase with cupredoxin domain